MSRKSPDVLLFVISFLGLLLASPSPVFSNDLSGEVSVSSRIIKRVNPLIFGNNTLGHARTKKEKGEYCCYASGQWDPNNRKPDVQTLDLARKIHISCLRYPGGCGTHHYDWKETIGPVSKRPRFAFGLDEFLELCKSLNAEPIITLNNFDTLQDIADMVEYLNSPLEDRNPNEGMKWPEIRARNGHPEPYGVKYFEFGNEVWHGNHGSIRCLNPETYASQYLDCRKVLKQIDQNIQMGAVLHGPGVTSWDMTVMSVLKSAIDFGVIHAYPVHYESEHGTPNSEELFRIALAAPDQFERDLESLGNYLTTQAGKEIPLAITEYNGHFVQNEPIPYRHCLGNALLNADLMRVFLTTKVPILCANYWHYSNSYWGMVYNSQFMKQQNRYYMRPNYLVLDMFAQHFGTKLLDVDINVPVYMSDGFAGVDATSEIAKKASSTRVHRVSIDAWTINPAPEVQTTKNAGQLTIEFKCTKDLNYHHSHVRLKIHPRHRYRVRTNIKVENITTNSGICMAIVDSRGWEKTNWNKMTHGITGTTDWRELVVEFEPLADADAIKIQVRRISGGGPFSGTVYIRDVVLEDLGPSRRKPTPYTSVLASTDENEKKLYLMVINKHLKKPLKLEFNFEGFSLLPKGKCWILNGPAIDSINDRENVNVRVSEESLSFDDKNVLRFTFEPHSLTAIEVDRKH